MPRETKKLVCGTRRSLLKEIEARKAKGWRVARTEMVPRGLCTKLFTHIAYIERR